MNYASILGVPGAETGGVVILVVVKLPKYYLGQLSLASLRDRSFSVAEPKLWNSLPATLRQPDIELGRFRRLLKTFLFS